MQSDHKACSLLSAGNRQYSILRFQSICISFCTFEELPLLSARWGRTILALICILIDYDALLFVWILSIQILFLLSERRISSERDPSVFLGLEKHRHVGEGEALM